MPGGRSSHASKRAQQALNRPTYGGGNKKYGLPTRDGFPVMLKQFENKLNQRSYLSAGHSLLR